MAACEHHCLQPAAVLLHATAAGADRRTSAVLSSTQGTCEAANPAPKLALPPSATAAAGASPNSQRVAALDVGHRPAALHAVVQRVFQAACGCGRQREGSEAALRLELLRECS